MRSGKPCATTRKSADKRGRVIRAATEIINTKTYALATMTEIAATLQLRDATLYYYFPNKQALAHACHVSSLERFERLLQDAGRMAASGAARLTLFTESLLADSEQHGPLLYFGDISYLEEFQRDAITAWAGRLTASLEQFLKDGIADGSIMPCETALVVQLFLGMLIWLAKWVPAVEGLTSERLMRAIAAMSLVGLSGKEGSASF